MITEPTDHELLAEAIKVSSLPEADALRRKFMARRNHGDRAWKVFVLSVDATLHALNPDHPDVDIAPDVY
tara:strand:- start:4673 stop:4882 length:210 start_codon:yes stop_codon:yes gene_type:complete